MLLLLMMLFYFLWFCCVDVLNINAKQKWNWRLAENKQNKRTAETLIVNTPSEGLNISYHLLFLLLLLLISFLCCWWDECLKIIAKRKWNWRLAENGRNKILAEGLIVNTPSGDQTALTLFCCCCWCSIFCAVAVESVSIKTLPLNF